MEITKNCAIFLILTVIQLCASTKEKEEFEVPSTISSPKEYNDSIAQDVKTTLSRVKRQFGYGYDPYYYRQYPLPIPIIIGGGFIGGRGYGFGGGGFGGRGFGGRGFGGRGFGGRGYGGRGFGGRGIGGRGIGGGRGRG